MVRLAALRAIRTLGLTLTLVSLAGCDPGGASTGGACVQQSDCAAPNFCVAEFAGGSCTTDCTDKPCAAGTACGLVRTADGGRSWCLTSCTDRSGCRSGAQCLDGVCQPNCSDTQPCATGTQCDATGACVPYDGAPEGAVCAVDTDCSTRLCLLGVCAKSCDHDGACAATQTCVPHRIGDDGEVPPTNLLVLACGPRRASALPSLGCDRDGDCDRGACMLGICVEACATTQDCHASAQQCVKLPVPLDSGDAPAFSACLPQRALLPFDIPAMTAVPVPPTTQSMALFTSVPGYNTAITVGVTKLLDPAGKVIFTQPQSNADYYLLDIRYVPTEGTSTMLVPNSPRVALSNGAYLPSVGTSSGLTSGSLRSFLKISNTPITSGTASLNFYLTDLSQNCTGTAFTVANAPARLSVAVAKITSIYASVGIAITEVTWHGANGAANSIHTNIGTTGAQPEDLALALQAATDGQPTTVGLDVVLLRSITDLNGNNSGVLGIAGGIPSSPILGTPHSGAVVSIQTLCSFNQTVFGETTAHELGHTLGLFHNGESNGQRDPLTDTTPTDMTNLMYWEENSGDKLSAQQGTVVRGDPKVRF